jgi:PilZ domain-containing protein
VSTKDLTHQALYALAQQPSDSVEAFSNDGGVVTLRLLGEQRGQIAAEAPRLRVREGLDLLVRTNDPAGGGHDIALTVVEVVQQAEWMARVHLRVLSLERRHGVRVTPRARIEEVATVHVLGARAIAQDEQAQVRLADLSPSGVAFTTDLTFHTGDRVAMLARVSGRSVRLQARVLQTAAMSDGRQRVGCEILLIADEDRRRIAELTARAIDAGSPEQRLPRAS